MMMGRDRQQQQLSRRNLSPDSNKNNLYYCPVAVDRRRKPFGATAVPLSEDDAIKAATDAESLTVRRRLEPQQQQERGTEPRTAGLRLSPFRQTQGLLFGGDDSPTTTTTRVLAPRIFQTAIYDRDNLSVLLLPEEAPLPQGTTIHSSSSSSSTNRQRFGYSKTLQK